MTITNLCANIYIMDDPIKIIYKYKNSHRRTQYHIYIFIGGLVPKNILNILKTIKDWSLFECLDGLSDKEIRQITQEYGPFWYNKFFNSQHVDFTKKNVEATPAKKKVIIEKFGEKWYNEHFIEISLETKKTVYSYETVIREERENKVTNKKRKVVVDQDIDLDYTTKKKPLIRALYGERVARQKGGMTNEVSGPCGTKKGLMSRVIGRSKLPRGMPVDFYQQLGGEADDLEIDSDVKEEMDIGMIPEEDEEDELDEKYDTDDDPGLDDDEMKEIEDLYKDLDADPDKDVAGTAKLIKNALGDESVFDDFSSQFVEFDTSQDDNLYDGDLKNIFTKQYVINQYLFKDDTIRTIKNKICGSIKNNPKFDTDSFLLPSRQYIWASYLHGDNVEKIMIGQKWMKRNELLQIDIEPNSNLRVYEELRMNLRYLRDNIKRYGTKIKREDDDYNILFDYMPFVSNNELYMCDIYNELGTNYQPNTEELKNITDVYIKIYFPRIPSEDVRHIINYLGGNKTVEKNRQESDLQIITNDLLIENEVMNDVEQVKKTSIAYKNLFKERHVLQSTIHTVIYEVGEAKDKTLDLYRVFDNFIMNADYPFLQYQTADGQLITKSDERQLMGSREQKQLFAKWFENAPYGLNFKIRVREQKGKKAQDLDQISGTKYVTISLQDTGRLEYKTQWKEEEEASIKDVIGTYRYVRKLLEKINGENNKFQLTLPSDNQFEFAFINLNQRFILPSKFLINHNDVSEFARYFFPYIALVIDPRKRVSKYKKADDKSKYGTYFRFKRISKYENKAKIEQRILYFMRNYDYSDADLASEISKQFNITEARAMDEIENVASKHPNLKKSRKILKKLEDVTRTSPPGIEISIQGKKPDRYKIRISGARDQEQIDRMLTFMNIFIHLYVETYLYKKPERQIMKEKLKKLVNIAKRRHRVDEFVDVKKETHGIKQMALIDNKRIGFKPEKGQNQYSRSCQNSGKDKRRLPQQYVGDQIEDLKKDGYKMNPKTGQYEKTVMVKRKGDKKPRKEVIRLVEVKGSDGGENIYYACNPDDNGEHMHIGFLTKGSNPYGECMPCCFKTDHAISNNPEKKGYYYRCMGKDVGKKGAELAAPVTGDKLYILQDSNKIQEGRFSFLPKYLDIFINIMLKRQKTIKNHYLTKSKTGYFLKYGVIQTEYPFLNAIGALFEMTPVQIKERIEEVLKKDRYLLVFTSLNNGDIRARFETIENYLEFIRTNEHLDFDMVGEILSIPGVLHKSGVNLTIFEKHIQVFQTALEKEEVKEDYLVLCQNPENTEQYTDPTRRNIFVIKDTGHYYPIVMLQKKGEADKAIHLTKHFEYQDEADNIVNHVLGYYKLNCSYDVIHNMQIEERMLNAKQMYNLLKGLGKKEFMPRYQIIDTRYKCKYLITTNLTILPVRPSGSIFNLHTYSNFEKLLSDFDSMLGNLTQVHNLAKGKIDTKPTGVYYDKKENKKIHVTAIKTNTGVIPLKPEMVKMSNLGDLVVENKPVFNRIDQEILKGPTNYRYDDRMKSVKKKNYETEGYSLFRLEFSDYLQTNNVFREKMDKYINSVMNKKDKKRLLKKMIYRVTDNELYGIYRQLVEGKKTAEPERVVAGSKFTHVVNRDPDVKMYEIDNNRMLCGAFGENSKGCQARPHCAWVNNQCKFKVQKKTLIDYINRIGEELVENGLKKRELYQDKGYYVSDIVDYNRFTKRDNQVIIKGDNTNVTRVLEQYFGKGSIPKIGKKRGRRTRGDIISLESEHPIKDMGDYYVQEIIEQNNSILRAVANGLFWIKNQFYDIEYRNLGYYSELQTDLSNYFKSLVSDWLLNPKQNTKPLMPYLKQGHQHKNVVKGYVIKMGQDVRTINNNVPEMHVISQLYQIPIIVYNENNQIIYIFEETGLVYDAEQSQKYNPKYDTPKFKKSAIQIRYLYLTDGPVPDRIEAIYYK